MRSHSWSHSTDNTLTIQISALPLASFGQVLNLSLLSPSVSLYPRVVMRMNLLTYVKLLEQCLVLNKHYRNICYVCYFSN